MKIVLSMLLLCGLACYSAEPDEIEITQFKLRDDSIVVAKKVVVTTAANGAAVYHLTTLDGNTRSIGGSSVVSQSAKKINIDTLSPREAQLIREARKVATAVVQPPEAIEPSAAVKTDPLIVAPDDKARLKAGNLGMAILNGQLSTYTTREVLARLMSQLKKHCKENGLTAEDVNEEMKKRGVRVDMFKPNFGETDADAQPQALSAEEEAIRRLQSDEAAARRRALEDTQKPRVKRSYE